MSILSKVLVAHLICMYTGIAAGGDMIELPIPAAGKGITVEKALSRRHSVRDYNPSPLTGAELSRLLWSCQGLTGSYSKRTAPSAGALYPLEVFVVVERVERVPAGIYHYHPAPDSVQQPLEVVSKGNFIKRLAEAALGQECIYDCAAALVVTGIVSRTAAKYGDRARRYVLIEVGHAAQNVCLEVESLGLGCVTVGAFNDKQVQSLLATEAEPFYIIPIGHPRQ